MTKEHTPFNIFWFRRDLRLHDNAGLYHALKEGLPVQPVFIFDRNILDKLPERKDARVEFILEQIRKLEKEIEALGSKLWVFHSTADAVFEEISQKHNINSIFTNHDYEPYAKQRDLLVQNKIEQKGGSFYTFKDQCVFEKNEVMKDDGTPYTVFTPYKNKWIKTLLDFHLKSYPTEKYFKALRKTNESIASEINLKNLGFETSGIEFPDVQYKNILKDYAELRNFPSVDGTSKISIHLRFGTVSIRDLARNSKDISEVWLNELIWRDFYFMILWHFPHVATGSFKPAYDHIKWRNNEEEFERWCEGNTGYPIIDAGMRELNATGFMHNRVRMIVASFLTKHLLIDWKWGEAYFANKLLDFELSSNNGGWQWAAGSGCDAAPYFRIFNPAEQTKKFDANLLYIKKWVPEFQELNYPAPIVDHKFARERCLNAYKEALAP